MTRAELAEWRATGFGLPWMVGRTAVDARSDALGGLTAYAGLLFLIPAILVVGPLGAAGSPASIFGLGCLMWWAAARMLPKVDVPKGVQPVAVAMAVLGAVVLISYACGNVGGLDGDEMSSADRGLLTIASWAGIALVAADLLRSRRSLDALLRRIVIFAAIISVIGLLQFGAGVDVAAQIRPPGLTNNGAHQGINAGGDLRRVAGTASHAIEFGMVLALVLPFALHFALHAKRHKARWWGLVLVIAMVLPTSLSRSAILAVVVEVLVLFVRWNGVTRLAAVALTPVFIVGLRFSSPGLVGTMFNQFASAGDDPSLQGRADSRDAVGRLIEQTPWFGRGFNTYIPDKFQELGLAGVNHGSLDNQYLGTVVEMGYVGLAALIAVLVIAVGIARGARKRAKDEETRNVAQSFLAAFLGVALGMATFDGLGFPMFTGLFFLLLGCAGALWRITKTEWNGVPPSFRARVRRPGLTGAAS